MLERPVIDHWWQTETGWAIAANCMGLEPLPVKAGSPTKPTPGYQVEVLDVDGRPWPRGNGRHRDDQTAPAAWNLAYPLGE